MEARWKCFKYAGYYRIAAQVYSPLHNTWKKVDFILDTGFSGDIFLEKTIYEELGLHLAELPRRLSPSARTLAGSIPLRAAYTILKIRRRKIKVTVLTPLYGQGRNLLGRHVANKLEILLQKDQKTCVK